MGGGQGALKAKGVLVSLGYRSRGRGVHNGGQAGEQWMRRLIDARC